MSKTTTTHQTDLFRSDDFESIPIPDGSLKFWQQIDLGVDQDHLLTRLVSQTDWQQHQIQVFGKTHLQPRLSAWYGEFGYRYSGLQLDAAPLTPLLAQLKHCVQTVCGYRFNSLLLNYYRDQNDCMGMHSDDEPELGARPVIASLSLGESRTFVLRHKTNKHLDTIRLALGDRSLLLMEAETQKHWRHGINRQKTACGARINLTFRNILSE